MLHLNIPLIVLKPTKVGFLAISEQQSEIDTILNSNAQDKLRAIGLEAKLPVKLKEERSVICRKIDSSVGEISKEELKEDISSRYILLDAEEVTKFGSYTHLFKVEFKNNRTSTKSPPKCISLRKYKNFYPSNRKGRIY